MEAIKIIEAIFNSFAYNREFSDMVKLCEEVRDRVNGFNSNHTDDGNVIYGFFVLLYGEYGTSPRSGWLLDKTDEITGIIDNLINGYKILEEVENEQNRLYGRI